MQQSDVLNSWKEISNYIGRGVRTVQRWEKDFGLPVRRPSGHLRGSVFAMRHDIDLWLSSREAREAEHATGTAVTLKFHARGLHFDRLHKNRETLAERCVRLENGTHALEATLQRTESLREKLRSTLQPLHNTGT